MALHSELPVYRDTYQMLLRIYALTQDFGREFKYTLGQDMKRDSLQLVRCIYRANRSADKKEHLIPTVRSVPAKPGHSGRQIW